MQRIVAGIDTIKQHLEAIKQTPEAYRPPCCPHCGLKTLWQHGHYERKADRRAGQDSLNPVPICRYCCSGCRRTCSRLPACIAPRRWYDWSVQQALLAQRLNGSRRRTRRGARPARRRSLVGLAPGAQPVVRVSPARPPGRPRANGRRQRFLAPGIGTHRPGTGHGLA